MSTVHKFYRDKPEWSDVKPLKQDESPRNIVRIAYSDTFTDAHNYIRAVMAADERSERALELTNDVLEMNAGNYSIWAYRRNILLSLGTSLRAERHYIKTLLIEHPKLYQLWYHLQWLTEQLTKDDGDLKTVFDRPESASFAIVKREFELILELLSDDAKNYHAWQYRRWLADHFCVPNKNELDFTTSMLAGDALNNSAWNHRFYTIVKTEITEDIFDGELKFVMDLIYSAPHNESACNYILGLLSPLPEFARIGDGKNLTVVEGKQDDTESIKTRSNRLLKVREQVEDAIGQDISGAADSPVLQSFLVEILVQHLELRIAANQVPSADGVGDEENLEDLLQRILDTCERLATELDRVRVNYWQYRRIQIEQMKTSTPAAAPGCK